MGKVFDVQRFSIHDGPGIRTTVFFKGCPARCLWCHNPESQSASKCISLYADKCRGCGACAAVCENHKMTDGIHVFNRDACSACGKCVSECAFGALESFGYDISAEELIREVKRDATFYKNSGGGLTVSGGEPLAQPSFLFELLSLAKAEGLHTCIETCGYAPSSVIEKIAPLTDIFLFDIKESDSEKHLALTGVPLSPILENLRLLNRLGAKTVLRCPIIPSVNLSDEHLSAIADLACELESVEEVNVMAYHTLGNGKYSALGMKNPLPDLPAMSDAEKSECIEKIKKLISERTTKTVKVL